ncbi:N-terminal nucleophile aminohydrolase [Mytilinidion resinicola]|uniref:Proteasome subunit beta n=1 Tax=Mytilinidion resinicola TaxID=574789 RepID=A0A6A6YNU3_9PEZI|nr:N-terminal nucleophile aminohydrolase [Mytilinidion resinicola]KAF2810450.1 N-terminal nucleophile aminohydrolase [Mytilinidion resinicola]
MPSIFRTRVQRAAFHRDHHRQSLLDIYRISSSTSDSRAQTIDDTPADLILTALTPSTPTSSSPSPHSSRLYSSSTEVLLGITGKDFTIVAASKAAMRGATILKASDDKTRALNSHSLMAFSGEAGDTIQFAEYIQANIQLYSMRNAMDLSPSATANFVRGELARALRSRKPYTVNLLLGGYDQITDKPSLYWIDYLASLAPLPYAAHGYAQYYCLSILDKHHHPDITFEQGMKILRMCTDELKRRLPVDFKGVLVKVITKDGIREEEYADDHSVACP